MNFMNRYSIRRYKSDKIKDEWVKEILDAMLLSPSGKNKKPWEFKKGWLFKVTFVPVSL